MSDASRHPPHDPGTPDQEEVNPIELLAVLFKHGRLVLGLPIAAGFITAIVTLFLPNVYTATARVLAPQAQSSGLSALLSGASPLSGIVASSLGIKSSADLYAGLLQAHTVADAIIERFDLRRLYEKDSVVETRRVLFDNVTFSAGKDGIVVIQVDDESAERSAAIANAFVEELDKLTQRVAVTEGSRKRVFLEKQLKEAKDSLVESEVALRRTMEHTGLIQPDEQGRVVIESIAQLQALIAAKEIQLSSLRVGVTDTNPDYVRARQELAGLKQELQKLERSNQSKSASALVPAEQLPGSGLEYVRRLRDVKYYETLFEVVAKQYEVARAEEAADSGMVQVVDTAVPPDFRSKPNRLLIVLLAVIASLALAAMLAFFLESLEKAKQDPTTSEHIRSLTSRFRL